ncbi:predicted membrane-associated, metal-dependent hydrolase [Solibacillus silvestris StLB046]|uniref:Predicted membrane-associated, metal-dependent hydrolase n=1 Tax=Solibacillus silvestris (strain StLB046) TaxID=1002809 RepID=F2FAR9_SOLSS|nr:hypothetical protein A9986_11615 [Solibacillus silvestris]BAK17235.1 predicted membrane-associated, metal-dependent hydrolase [Solibacillus silvestris StLB046]
MKRNELKHFLLGGYTIGFIVGWLVVLISVINPTFNLSFSFKSIFCILVVLPILYWTYRYSGMVFNDQTMKVKLIYSFVLFLGFCFGIFFTELLLN